MLQSAEKTFQVRLKSGLTYHFDRKFTDNVSPILHISDPYGNWLTYTRKNGRLIRISTSSGKQLDITCRHGRLVHIGLGEGLGTPRTFAYLI